MSRTVRAALIQASNAESPDASIARVKQAMIDKHLELIAEAASQGARVCCLQELFYGPYFCAEQETRWYELTEPVPDGPTITLMAEQAKKHSMILVVPVYEVGESGGHHFFSMKLVDGGDLMAHVEGLRGRRREMARLMVKVARAVHHGAASLAGRVLGSLAPGSGTG